MNGQLYKAPCALVLGVEDDSPVFAQVNAVYVVDRTRVVADVNLMATKAFNMHYHAYVIEKTVTQRTVVLDTLHNPFPLHVRKLANSKRVIVVKHHISGTLQS